MRFSATLLLLLGAFQSSPAWIELGGSATSGGVSATPFDSENNSVALDSAGNPAIAWQQQTGANAEIYVRQWNGTAWMELGGSGSGGGISSTALYGHVPQIAIGPDGFPVVAWQETDPGAGTFEVFLKRWNGTVWIDVGGSASTGGISATATDSTQPQLVLDSAGNPAVAWLEATAPGLPEVYFKRWNGSAWEELGGSATGGGVSSTASMSDGVSLTLDAADKPVIAWSEWVSPTSDVLLRRWNGTTWEELGGSATGGGISANAGKSANPWVALDGANPVVCWCDNESGSWELYVKHWDGVGWSPYGATPVVGPLFSLDAPFYSRPSVRVVPGQSVPHVCWVDPGVLVHYAYWNGASWAGLGGSESTGIGDGIGCAMAVDSSGLPVVSWSHYTTNYEIYARRWSLTGSPPPPPPPPSGGGTSSGGGGGGGGCSAGLGSTRAMFILVFLLALAFAGPRRTPHR